MWRTLFVAVLSAAPTASLSAAEFFCGINVNGPEVTIEGRLWSAGSSASLETEDARFENQSIPLSPNADGDLARMIRSSVYPPRGVGRITISDIPTGTYSVFLYVWEDTSSVTFDVAIQGRRVAQGLRSGSAGDWTRHGPWPAAVTDGSIAITTRGGHVNVSGIEIWKGDLTAEQIELTERQTRFFESRIRPVLVENCYSCHSVEHETAEGNLLLDTRAAVRRGGDRGPAVVPGDPARSLLLAAVRHEHADLEMPPGEQLSVEQITDLEAWIRDGAPDPRDGPYVNVAWKRKLDQGREHWSFLPVRDPPVPEVRTSDWALTPIDRFILAQLEASELAPVEPATRPVLIRRATFDLTGLPPTPEEIESFVNDPAPTPVAFARVVDRLLASPRYGEHWGRHWMDLVRYADTAGDNSDYPVPELYLYRNYVIDSFNADKPYDEFVKEQIAGDLLPFGSPEQKNERIIATGYIALARRFGSVVKDYPQHLTIEDTIDNLGRTVLGLTLSCARCHDHKFDPISAEDYYGLYGIFESTKYPFPGIELDKVPRDFVPLEPTATSKAAKAYAVSEGEPADARLQRGGDPRQLGEHVPRRFLEILGGQTLSQDEADSSGRLQLAGWLTDRSNPLTARVIVNRLWQYHFGSGIVSTPSDFGSRGLPPTNPALLDWLASRFVEGGWSLKRMHRLIMVSQVYALASRDETRQFAIDPANRLHWKFNRQRLGAESIRDAMLTISGGLDPGMSREPHPFPPVDKWQFTQHHPFRNFYPSRKRSVYLMTRRLNVLPFFATFDGPDANASTPVRDNSVTSVQALYLLNDEFVHEQARLFAVRLIEQSPDREQRLNRAFLLSFGRPPSDQERTAALDHLARVGAIETPGDAAGGSEVEAWASIARVLFRTNEFLYID